MFCLECGEPIDSQAPAQTSLSSPVAYTPKHLAEKILANKSTLEGERKQVTVLFADVKGSTALIADHDPEEADSLLKPVLDCMMDAVHRYGGTVTRVTGDGIMALFGAPLAHEDHAVRACYAALAIQRAMHARMDELRRERGVTVQVRVGLNSGEVVVRNIGNDLYMEYSAMGQTVHLAARMEELATPGTTLISNYTMNLVEGLVQAQALGPMPVKGLADPQEVYELEGVSTMQARLRATAAYGLTPFVVRLSELDSLASVLERAGGGHGQVVGVVGEPGIGKTRLFYEFNRSSRTHDWLVLETDAVSYGQAMAYLPVVQLLKAYFHIEDRDDSRMIREKVSGKLVTLDEKLMPMLPALLALADVAVDDNQWLALDPTGRREQTLDALKRLLLRESQIQPVCLVIENLHWVDSETQILLDRLVESLPGARLLLLVNYRPEYQHNWGSRSYYTQLRLDPLPADSVESFLAGLLGGDVGLEPLKQILIERTDSNPFFIEESVRALVETGALVGERGAYRAEEALPSIKVPATVQAVLAARLDRLGTQDKRLLQSAAVIGKDVPHALLEATAELPEEALHTGLANLQAAEFLYEARLFPDIEYTFKHGLTHEVAYESLLRERRKALHAQILQAIEWLYPDRVEGYIEQFAYHAFRGEVWDKAFTYLQQAGAKSAARCAHREAIGHFEHALTAASHLPDNRDITQRAIDLRFKLRSSLFALGEFDRLIDYLREAEAMSDKLSDRRRLGEVAAYMTNYYFWIGKPEQAVETGERSVAIASDLQDFTLKIRTKLALGQAYFSLGQYHQSTELLRETLILLEGDHIYESFGLAAPPSITAHTFLAWSLAELGDFTEAIAVGENGVRLGEALGQPFSLAVVCMGLAGAHLRQGNIEAALPALERSLGTCERWNAPLWAPICKYALGSAYTMAGRLNEALPLLQEAVERSAGTKVLMDHPLFMAQLGNARLLTGAIDEATRLGERSLALAREQGSRGNEGWVLRLLGEAAALQVPPDREKAYECFQQAAAISEGLGMRPLLAQCHFGLGRFARRMNDVEQAKQHLTMAANLFIEMDMRFWAEKVEAELQCGSTESVGLEPTHSTV